MEELFSPCDRLRALVASQAGAAVAAEAAADHRDSSPTALKELNLDVSTADLVSATRAFTYADLHAMLLGNEHTVAWLTPHAVVMPAYGSWVLCWGALDESCYISFNIDGQTIVALARSPEHLSVVCGVILQLLAASVVRSVTIRKWQARDDALINADTLAYLMAQCQSLKVLSLQELGMDEDHILVLGTYSRPGLKIELIDCTLTKTGASALAEVLGRNQGPTKLEFCDVDNIDLANGLRGNSRLMSLRPRLSHVLEVANQELLAFAGALKDNKGLIDFDLRHAFFRRDFVISDESWDAVCDSLKTHPTLQVLHLQYARPFRALLAATVLQPRIQVLVDMMKMNMSIHTIWLPGFYPSEQELFRRSILPYLERNRLRPRLRAIQKTHPISYRTKVLGRALLSVRTSPNRFWMLLSGNAELAFLSTTATTIVAASRPTPTTTAVPVNIGPAVATAAVTATITRAASATGTYDAGNVALATASHARISRKRSIDRDCEKSIH